MKYEDYLKTDHWKRLRHAAFKAAGHRCVACGVQSSLEAHHMFYRKRWSDTRVEDLLSLCPACHSMAHFACKWGRDEEVGREAGRRFIAVIQARRRRPRPSYDRPSKMRRKTIRASILLEAVDHGLNIKQ